MNAAEIRESLENAGLLPPRDAEANYAMAANRPPDDPRVEAFLSVIHRMAHELMWAKSMIDEQANMISTINATVRRAENLVGHLSQVHPFDEAEVEAASYVFGGFENLLDKALDGRTDR